MVIGVKVVANMEEVEKVVWMKEQMETETKVV